MPPIQPANIITLTTDFGLIDSYVGQMKGMILQNNPGAQIVDLTHAIEPQDILSAAITIHSSYRYFPRGTVHLVVVDPGVGGDRSILAAASDDYLFIAPDNGVLSLFLKKQQLHSIHKITNTSLFSPEISSTFHGRDIMAPVAAQLAHGLPLDEVGPAMAPDSCLVWDLPEAQYEGDTLAGRVIHIDHFGNIRTSITTADLTDRAAIKCIRIGDVIVDKFCDTYSQQAPGELLALIDSGGYLEIAANQGNAAEMIRCKTGEEVEVILNCEVSA